MSKVLIVDDDETLLGAMGQFLELAANAESIRCRSFDDVKRQLVAIQDPELVVAVLDINLGAEEPSGIDVYQWLRAQGYSRGVVFLTGHAKEHPLVKQAKRIDGVDVLEKPVSAETLVELVKERSATASL